MELIDKTDNLSFKNNDFKRSERWSLFTNFFTKIYEKNIQMSIENFQLFMLTCYFFSYMHMLFMSF